MDGERMAMHSEEGEQGVLGSLLIDAARVYPIAAGVFGLTPGHFYVPSHRAVASAVWKLSEKRSGVGVDIFTVQAALRDAEELDAVGGPVFLDKLIEATPTASHAEYYCELVRNTWMLREVVQRAAAVQTAAVQVKDNVEAFVSRVPDEFAGIVGVKQEEASNADVLEEEIVKWEKAKAFREGDQAAAPAIGLETPFDALTDMMCGLEPGVTIIAGRPSSGKTTLEDMISQHLAEKGARIGRVTLDSRRASLLSRSACRMAGVSLPKLKLGFARKDQIDAVREAKTRIAKMPMWIRMDLYDIAAIRMWALEKRRRDGMDLLTIDYVQQIQASQMGRAGWDEVAKTTYVIGQLKRLALQDLGIPVVVLSQLSRRSEQENKGVPDLTDLRGSGGLEQDAEKVLMLSIDRKKRAEMDDKTKGGTMGATKHKRPVTFHLAKNKDGEQGILQMWLYPPYFRFEQAGDEWVDYALPMDGDEEVHVSRRGVEVAEELPETVAFDEQGVFAEVE